MEFNQVMQGKKKSEGMSINLRIPSVSWVHLFYLNILFYRSMHPPLVILSSEGFFARCTKRFHLDIHFSSSYHAHTIHFSPGFFPSHVSVLASCNKFMNKKSMLMLKATLTSSFSFARKQKNLRWNIATALRVNIEGGSGKILCSTPAKAHAHKMWYFFTCS